MLEANGKHVLTDMWTSAAVVAGVAIVWVTGIAWLDPVIAIVAALNILASGLGLIRRSYDGLLDWADDEDTERILGVLRATVESGDIAEFHQLRHRSSDDQVFIEAHLLVGGDLSIAEAHSRATRVEEAIQAVFENRRVQITTHIEPSDHESAHPGGHQDPPDPLVRD